MSYVDGFLVAVPTERKEAYRKLASEAAAVFREHGATRVVEAWADDVPEGKVTSFPMAVKLEPGEAVVFSWVEWPSREVRDAGNAKVMADPRMQMEGKEMPFSMERIIFGGFLPIVEA
jgi:uncharacterized protein YbaA (DUF1428 family)